MAYFPTIDLKTFIYTKLSGLSQWVKGDNKYTLPANVPNSNKGLSEVETKFPHSQIFDTSTRLFFDTSTLLSVTDVKGNIIFANDKYCEVSKYLMGELIGQPCSIIRHPDMPDSVFKEMWGIIGKGKIWHGEIKNRAKDGLPYWVLATIAPIMGENGKPDKYISMCVDITHQKEVEQELITHQKEVEQELKEARKKVDIELFQNISYAKHVHDAFLTTEDKINQVFPNSFLIYKALKIISGDFYRIDRKDDTSIIVMGDSTGHGVSASYISHLVLSILNRILKKEGAINPSKMLGTMHKEISHITHLNNNHNIIESADTIICTFDHRNRILNYSSAKMKGVIIHKGEVIHMNKDRCSIGELSEKPFYVSDNEFQLQNEDCLYLFSDGINDQIGGAKNKKLGYKTLVKALAENYSLPMQQQKKNISEILNTWQGDNEQTDDMTLLGIKIG
ncbi:MAG TPA: SpoIIE family protein phosphatase [Bacteroidia bacterium]